jgi:hypothetical protein
VIPPQSQPDSSISISIGRLYIIYEMEHKLVKLCEMTAQRGVLVRALEVTQRLVDTHGETQRGAPSRSRLPHSTCRQDRQRQSAASGPAARGHSLPSGMTSCRRGSEQRGREARLRAAGREAREQRLYQRGSLQRGGVEECRGSGADEALRDVCVCARACVC